MSVLFINNLVPPVNIVLDASMALKLEQLFLFLFILFIFLSLQILSHDPDLSQWLHPADLDLCPHPVPWPVMLALGRGQRSDGAPTCSDPAGSPEPVWRKRDHLGAAAPVAPRAPRHGAERRKRTRHDDHDADIHDRDFHDQPLDGERFSIPDSHTSACPRSELCAVTVFNVCEWNVWNVLRTLPPLLQILFFML